MFRRNTLHRGAMGLFKRVNGHTTTQDYRNKEAIYAQGEKATAMFYIETGNVKLTVISKGGKKAVVAILRKGDLFGEGCLVSKSLRVSTATAIHESKVLRVDRTTITRVLHEEPAFAKLFIAYLLSRIGRIEEDFVDQIFSSSERRLARVLLQLAHFGRHSKPESATLKISQQTLAEMVGTTRSRISHFMNRFRKLGLIDYNGAIEVHKSLALFLLNND